LLFNTLGSSGGFKKPQVVVGVSKNPKQ